MQLFSIHVLDHTCRATNHRIPVFIGNLADIKRKSAIFTPMGKFPRFNLTGEGTVESFHCIYSFPFLHEVGFSSFNRGIEFFLSPKEKDIVISQPCVIRVRVIIPGSARLKLASLSSSTRFPSPLLSLSSLRIPSARVYTRAYPFAITRGRIYRGCT